MVTPSRRRVELGLVDLAMGAHAIAAQPAGRRQFEHARKAAVIGQQQQALGVDVEPADRDDARQVRAAGVENRRAAFRVAGGGDEAARLVEQEQAGALGARQRLAVDADVVGVAHIEGGAGEHFAVDADAALRDPVLGVAARTKAGARHRPWRCARPRGSADSALVSVMARLALSARAVLAACRARCRAREDRRWPKTPMSAAFAEARAAEARGEAPIGAALARDGEVIASAGNRTREDDDPTAHAEMLAHPRRRASLGDERLTGCDLYVTLEPCAMCAGAISHARLRRLYFAAADRRAARSRTGRAFSRKPTCLHAPEVYGGIRESEAAELMRAFFAARR